MTFHRDFPGPWCLTNVLNKMSEILTSNIQRALMEGFPLLFSVFSWILLIGVIVIVSLAGFGHF